MPASFGRSVFPGSSVVLSLRGRPTTSIIRAGWIPNARSFNYLQSENLAFTGDPTATGLTSITACGWVRFDTNDEGNNDSGVICKDIPTSNGVEAYAILRDAGNAGKYKFSLNNGTSTQSTATMSNALASLTWYFMAGRWTSGSQIEMRVSNESGLLIASAQSASTVSGSIPLDSLKPVWIGRSFFGFFNGYVQRARVYGSRLTDAQIEAARLDTSEDQSALFGVQLTEPGQTEEDVSGHFSVGAFTGSALVTGPVPVAQAAANDPMGMMGLMSVA